MGVSAEGSPKQKLAGIYIARHPSDGHEGLEGHSAIIHIDRHHWKHFGLSGLVECGDSREGHVVVRLLVCHDHHRLVPWFIWLLRREEEQLQSLVLVLLYHDRPPCFLHTHKFVVLHCLHCVSVEGLHLSFILSHQFHAGSSSSNQERIVPQRQGSEGTILASPVATQQGVSATQI